MSAFYEKFESNVSVLVRETRDLIVRQYEKIIRRFNVNRSLINLEMECRYKAAGNEKVASRIISELGVVTRERRFTDDNYSITLPDFRMTFRETTETNGADNVVVEEYVKIPVYIPKSSSAFSTLEMFKDFGMKIQFSFEISDPQFTRYIRETHSNQFDTPFRRVKDRQTITDSRKPQFQWDITQVTNPERPRKEIEVELDGTFPVEEFMNNDPEGILKTFIIHAESNSRKLVYKSRSLLGDATLKDMIRNLNEALGSTSPRDAYIENLVPQVRNLQVEDLLKSNYGAGFAVTPKADGYRYFMVIGERHIVLLQKPSIYKVLYEGPDIPNDWVGGIFDGELIERENWVAKNLTPLFLNNVDNYYCIFDVVKFPSGITPVSDDVIGRVNELKKLFEETKRSGSKLLKWSENFNSFNFQPMYVPLLDPVKKTFFEIKPYDDASGSPWAASSAFFDTLLPKLRYVNDGLILTPLGKTYRELNQNLSLKWKPVELLSIDFRYIGGSLLVTLENREVPFQGSMQFPTNRTVYDILNPLNIPLRDGLVYEFVFDVEERKFRVTRPRFDKQVPNRYDVAVQVWNDIYRPLTQNLITGEGFDGVRECRREALWSWFRDLVVNLNCRKILDLSNIDPVRDFPHRFMDEEFPRIMRDVSMKRLSEYPDPGKLVGENFDLVIMDGGLAQYLSGADDIMLASIPNLDFYENVRKIIRGSRRVFIRSLPAIVGRNNFVTERLATGNNEELTLHYLDETRIRIKCMNQGLFYDFTIDSYYSVSEVTARQTIFPDGSIVISAGNRVINFEDQGPDNILNGKYYGIFWEYVFNVLTGPEYFRLDVLEPNTQVNVVDEPVEIAAMFETLALVQEPAPPQPSPSPVTPIIEDEEGEPVIRIEEDYPELPPVDFHTRESTREFLEKAVLRLDRDLEPVSGGIFDIVAKAIMILNQRLGVPYNPEVTNERASELKVLFGRMSGREIVELVFTKLGLGIVVCRRVLEGDSILSFRTQFPGTDIPRYGYILVESSQEGLVDLKGKVGLLTYGPENNVVIHPADPIIETLYKHNSRILYLNKRGITLMRNLSKLKQIRPIKVVTDRVFTDLGTPVAFQTKDLGAQVSSFIGKIRRKYKDSDITESIIVGELRSAGKPVINDLVKTSDLILQDNVHPENIFGRVFMSYRSKLLTKI